jgi:hypothetical protein
MTGVKTSRSDAAEGAVSDPSAGLRGGATRFGAAYRGHAHRDGARHHAARARHVAGGGRDRRRKTPGRRGGCWRSTGSPWVGRPLLAYHDHNGAQMRPKMLEVAADGARVAYVSDAGTPLVADPGYQLVRAAIEAGLPVTAAPGPSAALVALTLSGLPSDRSFSGISAHAGDGAARLDRGA